MERAIAMHWDRVCATTIVTPCYTHKRDGICMTSTPEFAILSSMQRQVIGALIGDRGGRTYRAAAEALGVHVGTVYEHLRRIRQRHPEAYAAVMAVRRQQLTARHVDALKRDRAHTRKWLRRRRNWEHYDRFGYWPWER